MCKHFYNWQKPDFGVRIAGGLTWASTGIEW
jgi:hypothetical protein